MTSKKTKRVLGIILIMASLGSLWFVPWVLVKAWLLPLPNTIEEQVNEAITDGLNGVIVYVDVAGRPPKYYAAGMHNNATGEPAYPQALFKIASISKLYVAVAVAKLVADERLQPDETLAYYLPETARRIENADKITLKMLARHRSGIPDFVRTAGYWENPTQNAKQTLELVLDKPAEFEPDKKYSYSNTNYVLLGEILDKTLGYSYRQYIREEILEPLKLSNTYGLLADADINKVMSGYDTELDGDLKYKNYINASGSMVATAEDVGIFLRALNDGSLLDDDEQAVYTSLYEYEHTGLLPGYSSIARYHKDINAVVVMFASNSGGYSWNLSEIVYNRIVKILKEKEHL